MRKLYHFPLSVASRKVRLALAEKKIEFESVIEKPWEKRREFIALNLSGELPVLKEASGLIVAEGYAILEYLEEAYKELPLLPDEPAKRVEVRRLISWFDQKFAREVSDKLVYEKVFKKAYGRGWADTSIIREGHANIKYHLAYIGWLAERRQWLAGEELSLADLTAAAHLSALAYLGDVPWDKYGGAKDWYARIKSRPSFRSLLVDQVPGTPPAKWYHDLDF